MLSDSIKYKDLRSEKHTYKLAIGSKRIEKLASLTVGSPAARFLSYNAFDFKFYNYFSY